MNAIIWADPAVRLKKHAELMALRADNARLRAALKEAPGHDEIWPGITGAEHFIELALEWHDGERATALGLGEEKITPEPDRDLEESEGNTWDDDPGWC